MPHLRFTRDKRGYENTYVVHSIRGRGKANPRILYWFRTPPNVRVGRGALDEGAIRAIEEQNPEISFDWTKILEAQPTPAALPDRRRRSREGTGREPQARRRGGRPGAAQRPDAGRAQESARPVAPGVPVPATFEPAARAGMFTDAPIVAGPTAAPAAEEMAETVDQAPASVPVTVYHGGADVLVASAVGETPRVPAVEALGSEQLGRLRARHAEILARITERAGSDPVQLEAMRRAAEALNPDSWVTDAEITAGLQHFDARLGEIRRDLGVKRRRRSRRGGRRRRGRGTGVGTGPAAGVTATSGAAPANASGLSDDADEAEEPEDDDPDDPADPTD